MSRKKVLLVAAELAGVAAVGGLAEYVLGLAAALLRRGHDVHVALPAYRHLHSQEPFLLREVIRHLRVHLGAGAPELTSVHEFSLPCPGEDAPPLSVFVLGSHEHFDSVREPSKIYDWPDHKPWVAFSRAVVDFIESADWRPDVIHCHDSHTALIPVYVQQLRDEAGTTSSVASARTVLTIHNLLNRGQGDSALVSYAGLPQRLLADGTFEFYGRASCLKAGLICADRVNTVSRTYAQEICKCPRAGFGLEGVLRQLRDEGKLAGIISGIDESRWRIPGLRYDGADDVDAVVAAKRAERQKLYDLWRWEDSSRPLIAFRSRWDHQKGVTLLADCARKVADAADLVVVTWGHPGTSPELAQAWRDLSDLAARAGQRVLLNPPGICEPSQVATNYMAADFLLIPSLYEPCGLVQMECQRFGAVPIVRRTGGLADTVAETEVPAFPSPNGFVFPETDEQTLVAAAVEAVERAVAALHDPQRMRTLIRNALAQRNSWDSRVPDYEALHSS